MISDPLHVSKLILVAVLVFSTGGRLMSAPRLFEDRETEAVIVSTDFYEADASRDFPKMWALLDESVKGGQESFDATKLKDFNAAVFESKRADEICTTHLRRRPESKDIIEVRYVYTKTSTNETRTFRYVLKRFGKSWRVVFASPSHFQKYFKEIGDNGARGNPSLLVPSLHSVSAPEPLTFTIFLRKDSARELVCEAWGRTLSGEEVQEQLSVNHKRFGEFPVEVIAFGDVSLGELDVFLSTLKKVNSAQLSVFLFVGHSEKADGGGQMVLKAINFAEELKRPVLSIRQKPIFPPQNGTFSPNILELK
jgi:hypothetical protein